MKLTTGKLESCGYTLWWKLHGPNWNRFWLIHECVSDGRTARRTDGRWHIARCSIMLSSAKKLLWRAYRKNSPTLFRKVPSPTLYTASPFLRLGVRNPTQKAKIPIAIISGTGTTDFKFGYIHSQGPSEQKPARKFGEKGACQRGRIQGLPIFWGTPYYLSNE